jgi:hypothetical protein
MTTPILTLEQPGARSVSATASPGVTSRQALRRGVSWSLVQARGVSWALAAATRRGVCWARHRRSCSRGEPGRWARSSGRGVSWAFTAAAGVIAALAVVLTVPDAIAALAAKEKPPTDLQTVITNLRNVITGLLVGLATLFATVGGLRYILAGGDPGEVEAAKRTLKYAAIGYGVAVLAPALVELLGTVVEG